MKSRTLLILFAIVLVLLAYVYFFEFKGKAARQEAKEKAAKLVDVSADDVQAVTLKKEDTTIAFKKDDKGTWTLTQPLAANADENEVSNFIDSFVSLTPERTVEEAPKDLKAYEIPKMEVTLELKGGKPPVKLLVGMENPLDKSFFAKREDQAKVVLLSSSIKSSLDKTVFDFRQKDVFKFETDKVKTIALKAKDVAWQAERKDADWFLSKPFAVMAKKTPVESLLNTLSELKAKAFVSEDKKPDEVAKFKLDKPDYEVRLRLPASNQEIAFALHKLDEKVYATTSASTKIVEVESSALTDLEKKPDEYQEKQVAVFSSWEATKLVLKKGGVALTVAKDKDEKWQFEAPFKGTADGDKVETLIRKIESLEAAGFIIPPVTLKDDGLASPQAEVAVTVKELGADDKAKEREIRLLVGREDTEKKQVVVKNASLDYLFWVDPEFLKEFPAKAEDWKPAPPPEEKK